MSGGNGGAYMQTQLRLQGPVSLSSWTPASLPLQLSPVVCKPGLCCYGERHPRNGGQRDRTVETGKALSFGDREKLWFYPRLYAWSEAAYYLLIQIFLISGSGFYQDFELSHSGSPDLFPCPLLIPWLSKAFRILAACPFPCLSPGPASLALTVC